MPVRDLEVLPVDGRVLRGEATRERVIDAAERCFGHGGFDDVSIRQIAREAGVTLGVVGFHGGSKRDLFLTVLRRRVETLNRARGGGLDRLLAGPGTPTIRHYADAYVTPYLEIASQGDHQWRSYALLIARTASEDRWQREVRDLYDPMALRFMDAIEADCPGLSRERLAAAFAWMVAAMLALVASRSRIVGLSGVDRHDDPMAYREMLVDFCGGGMERLLEGTEGESERPATKPS